MRSQGERLSVDSAHVPSRSYQEIQGFDFLSSAGEWSDQRPAACKATTPAMPVHARLYERPRSMTVTSTIVPTSHLVIKSQAPHRVTASSEGQDQQGRTASSPVFASGDREMNSMLLNFAAKVGYRAGDAGPASTQHRLSTARQP